MNMTVDSVNIEMDMDGVYFAVSGAGSLPAHITLESPNVRYELHQVTWRSWELLRNAQTAHAQLVSVAQQSSDADLRKQAAEGRREAAAALCIESAGEGTGFYILTDQGTFE